MSTKDDLANSALAGGISKDVRPLLDLIDTLRSLGIEQELALPQIAVMGDQSSGKSSVLEALSGVPFPRGTGLVTRCPCQLTMKHTAPGTPWRGEIGVMRSGVFSKIGELASPAELTAAIERVTTSLTEKSRSGFSRDSIVVSVSAPSVPDLTIIDLPGIVRTVTAGQDSNVITEVNDMVESYLMQDRTIVLAIVPANQDVATVDILERALRVDPTGERTIGVLTKPDLVGEGAEDEVLAVLRNERKPLKLGYVMVKNRSAKELKSGEKTGLREQAEAERRFFRTHAAYSAVDASLLGISNLTGKLTKLLTRRIEAVLPELKWELQEHFALASKAAGKLGESAAPGEPGAAGTRERRLEFGAARGPRSKSAAFQEAFLGTAPPESDLERSKLVLRILSDYTATLRMATRGDYRSDLLSKCPHLRLRSIADGVFHALERAISLQKPDFEAADFTSKLHQELRALRGRELPGLLNSYFFYGFMARHVEMWRPLIESAKRDLYDAAYSSSASLAEEMLAPYPGAVSPVCLLMSKHLELSIESMQTKVDEVFKQESDPFISKNELSDAILKVRFDRFEKAMEAVMSQCGGGPAEAMPAQAAPPPCEEEKLSATAQQQTAAAAAPEEAEAEDAFVGDQPSNPLKELVSESLGRWYMANHGVTSMSMVEDMRTVLIAYWGVAAKRITENVCMLLDASLLSTLAEDIETELLTLVQRNEDGIVDRLLAQDETIRHKRADVKAKKERVAAAMNSIAKFAPNVVARPREVEKAPEGPSTASLIKETAPVARVVSTPNTEPQTTLVRKDCLAQFNFTANGDNGGFIYWLGTSGRKEKFHNPHESGRVRVTSSGLADGTEDLLVSRKKKPCRTRDEADSWICIDLGRNRAIIPTHYTLLSGSGDPGFDLLHWNLEGYDARSDQWVDLHAETGAPRVLSSPWGVSTFSLDARNTAWRYLRLHHTGRNSRGTQEMAVSAWEFYGDLIAVQA